MKRKAFVSFIAVMLLVAGGCRLNKPGSSSLASIVIDEAPLSQIRAETFRVFTKEQYRVANKSSRKIVFEREGTGHDRLKYGRYEESLVMRVVVVFESYGEDSTLIRADAFAVRGHFSRAQKLMRMDRFKYQRMLDDVQEAIPISADEVE